MAADLLARFRPTVVFDSREQHWPCSAEYFVLHSSLEVAAAKDAQGRKLPGKQREYREVAARGSLTAAELPLATVDGQNVCEPGNLDLIFRLRPGRDSWGGQGSALADVPFYGFAQEWEPAPGRRVVDLTYCFLYTYNGSAFVVPGTNLGVHEGDLEHVVVRVDADSWEVLEVFFAAHSVEGRWLPPDACEWAVPGQTLRVFAARMGHASMPHAGVRRRVLGAVNDECDGRGPEWAPALVVEITRSADDPLAPAEPAWARFAHHWGDILSIRQNWWWKHPGEQLRRIQPAHRSAVEPAPTAEEEAGASRGRGGLRRLLGV